MSTLNRQSGVALVVVLLVVALVAVLATDMGSRLQLQVKRVANIKDANQAYWYAMGAEQFARKSIQEVLDLDDGVIHKEQPWSQEFTYPLEGGGIQAQLKDMQACFNLNAINSIAEANNSNADDEEDDNQDSDEDNNSRSESTATVSDAFYNLLTNAELEIDSYSAETLRDSVIDWVDEDDNTSDFGAEDGEYESRPIPYLSANGPMVNKSELRMINGVDLAWLTDLMPMLCAIPDLQALKININTVEQEHAAIIAGMLDISNQEAQSILSSRPTEGYDDIQDFFAEPDVNVSDAKQAWFDISTSYFILHTKTRYNNASFAMSTVFKVSENNEVSVLRREFGGII